MANSKKQTKNNDEIMASLNELLAKARKDGMITGVAELEREEPSYGGRKQFWHVVAKDDAGDVVSEGTFITKIVTKEHFAEKNRQREQR